VKLIQLATLVGSLGLCVGQVRAQDASAWYVNATDYACFMQNLDAFLEAPSDPVVIVLTRCPEPSMSLSDLVTNSGAEPDNGAVFQSLDVTVTELLIYSKAELECLREQVVEQSADLVQLPKEPCG